ncbi:MAG: hypothetical protein JWM59_914 [Verrucomicrobiales bacterium]|nr:hypothetical protein [Verrucomicrobiales bacterium]
MVPIHAENSFTPCRKKSEMLDRVVGFRLESVRSRPRREMASILFGNPYPHKWPDACRRNRQCQGGAGRLGCGV